MSVRQRMGAHSSVVPLAGPDLSAEYVIGHCGVGEDEGDDEKRTDQREAHAFRRSGAFPDRYSRWSVSALNVVSPSNATRRSTVEKTTNRTIELMGRSSIGKCPAFSITMSVLLGMPSL